MLMIKRENCSCHLLLQENITPVSGNRHHSKRSIFHWALLFVVAPEGLLKVYYHEMGAKVLPVLA